MSSEMRRTLLGLVSGFLSLALIFAWIYSPVDELPSVATPPTLPPRLVDVTGRPGPEDARIIVLGASLTAGYPYAPELDGSYARLLGVGLRSLHSDKSILVEAWAKPALDSVRLVEMAERALELEPTLLVVTLGSNEFANRVFSGQILVPANPFHRMAEKLSRSRVFLDDLARRLERDSGGSRAREQQALEKGILEKIVETAPGKPGLTGLPISHDDQDLLLGRLRESMIRIDELCKEKGTPLVFCVANYCRGGFWPWGISEGGRDPVVDALVVGYRQGHREGLLDRVEKALRTRPRRADLHFLEGRLLQEAGHHAKARVAFDAARDLDGVPMHLTGEVQRTLLATAQELSREILILDTPLEALGEGGIPSRSYYLDYGHLEESGHAVVALWLAQKLREGGYLPSWEARQTGSWKETFQKAVRRYQVTQVEAQSRRQARARMASANGAFSMLFGNYRDALPYLVSAFEGCLPAAEVEIAIRLSLCILRLSGRDKELKGRPPAEGEQEFIRLYQAYQKARKEGNLRELVERLRQGAKLGATTNH